MKRKIQMIIAMMLAITLIIPISGFATEIEVNKNEKLTFSQSLNYKGSPPIPGDMSFPFPVHKGPEDIEKISRRHNTDTISYSDVIIDIIQQLDEPLILDYLTDLVAFGPRVTQTTACDQAGDWIYNEFQSLGLDVRYHSWSNGGYQDENIEATLSGVNQTSDEIYIICGHYDSVSGSPGADDDGSGTVATLAAAYILSQYSFEHTIRFVTFSGEEQGLLGSEKYVQEAYANGDNIVATLNVDMIGFALTEYQGNNIKVYHNDESDWLVDFTDDIADQYSEYINLNVIPSGFSWGSDHYYFWEYGYDALFYHEYEFNNYYHSPQDTIENMNLTYDVKVTKLILATLATLTQPTGSSNPPETPNKPDGPTEGLTFTDYSFSTTTNDPEFDQIYYKWDWGNEIGNWEGPFDSGETVEIFHYWMEEGIYEIRVKAKDSNGSIESSWSDSLEIDITSRPMINIDIRGGLGLKASVENLVDIELNDLSWDISFDGGIILVAEGTSGIVDSIPIGETVNIQTERLFGIGLPQITVSVDELETTIRALIIGPIVIVIG